jgi:putative DNA primase/helicase
MTTKTQLAKIATFHTNGTKGVHPITDQAAPPVKAQATTRRKYKRLVSDLKASAQRTYNPVFVAECLEDGESGDARLLTEIMIDNLIFDHSEKLWFWWNGSFWEPDRANSIVQVASDITCTIYTRLAVESFKSAIELKGEMVARGPDYKATDDEAAQLEKLSRTAGAAKKRAVALRGVREVQRVLEFAKTGLRLGISGDEWDQATGVLPTVSGTINLTTGELIPSRPTDYMRTVAPTEYTGIDTPAPRFERFLSEILPEQPEVIAYLQTLLGYSMLGTAQLDLFIQLYGEDGRNGKDTLLELLFFVLGEGIASAVSNDVLINRKDRAAGSASPHIMTLRGKRLVWASETKEGERLDAGQIKLLTGGGVLRVRQLHKAEVSFEQTHLLLLLTNNLPHAPSHDPALWERIRLIKFLHRFVENPDPNNPYEHKADDKLKDELRQEASGVLAWLVRGCLEFQRFGLHTPGCVRMATAEYRKNEDTLAQFVEDWCKVDKADKILKITASALYNMYTSWCSHNNLQPMNGNTFGQRMKKIFDSGRDNAGNYYKGIGINPEQTVKLN